MEILALKRQALDQKQYLERLLAMYEAFQTYVQALKPVVLAEQPGLEVLQSYERFRLKFEEYETLFFEWHEGEQLINEAVAIFLRHPEEFRANEEHFRVVLMLATTKFQDILEKAGRKLKELHEQIALEEGQSKAEQVTHVPSSALTKLKDADMVAEIATKWAGKAIRFIPWAIEIIKGLHS
jgi:hypothetical protein